MNIPITALNKDYYAGGLMTAIGLGVIYRGIDYQVGSLTQMGPGFFPVALGVVLTLTGAAIALGALRTARLRTRRTAGSDARGLHAATGNPDAPTNASLDLRGPVCIALGIVAFVVFGQYGGLLPATFAVVFISALGDRQNSLFAALLLALVMVAIAFVVFWWALQVQLPLFQWG